MTDTDSLTETGEEHLAISDLARRRPPPLISRDATHFTQPAVIPVANQQPLPPGYFVVPQGLGGPQIFQGPDGTLYAIHSPGSALLQSAVQMKSPIGASVQNSRISPPVVSSAFAAKDSNQQVPLVPIYAPIQVAPSVAKKYQQMFQLPSTSRTDSRVRTSPSPTIRQVSSPLEINRSPTHVRYAGTSSSLYGEPMPQSPIAASPRHFEDEQTASSSGRNPKVLLSPTNCHVQSPTVNSFMEGLSTVQRASILQQHRRSLQIHERETQEYVVERDISQSTTSSSSSSSSSTSSRYAHFMQKETKNESSSLMKLLQSEPESETTLSSQASAIHRSSESHKSDSTLALLTNEPYLVRFYQFFQSSEKSKHLRMRILTTEGSASILKWIEVTRKASHIDPNLGPLDAVRILISSNGLCKLQVLFPYCKTLFTRFMPSSLGQASELFNELSPRHVLCPGIPDCENRISTLGYHPGSVRMIETPSVRRFDHEKCPLWHIPLPCNLYSESGQIMHHMCRQCKNLHNTLTRTVAKMSRFATTEHLLAGSSSLSQYYSHGSTKEGRLKPSKEKRPKRMASHGSTAADVATTQQEEGEIPSGQNMIKFYTQSDTEFSEDSETTTMRHKERTSKEDDTTTTTTTTKTTEHESSVLVISECSSSSLKLNSTSTAQAHLLIDSADVSIEISKHQPEEQTSEACDSGDEETLNEKQMSLEPRVNMKISESKSSKKRKQVQTDSMLSGTTLKKQKVYSSKNDLHSDCSDDSESNQNV